MQTVIFIIAIVALDQLSKFAVRRSMSVGQSIPVIKGLFSITYYRNDGAAFSSFSGHRALLIGFASIAIAAALFFLLKNHGKSRLMDWSLMLIISGGIGNLIDRAAVGEVTDMFSLSFFPPIFNVADIAITFGCLLMILYLFLDSGEKTS